MKRFLLSVIVSVATIVSGFAQDKLHNVKGTVYGDDGAPVIGAAVMVQGTSNGTITNEKGEYSVQASDRDVLVYTSLGYEDLQQKVDGRNDINVVMSVKRNLLDDVVVIAYGTQTKADLTGAVGVVETKDIKDESSTSIDQMLQGRIAGVDIASTGGDPEGGTTINIRGTRSISASNDPLIVVDGVIDAVDNLSDINPEDIKSVSVLKDASSTAIYGSRGANGVVLVTTKGDAKGAKLTMNFSAKCKVQQLLRKMEVMDATEFAQYRNDMRYMNEVFKSGSGVKPDVPQSDLQSGTKYYYEDPTKFGAGTDWQDLLTRTAVSQSYNFSLNAAERRSNIYFSVGYDNNQGIIKGTDSQRISTLLKVNRRLGKFVQVGARVNFTYKSTEKNKISLNGLNTESAVCLSPLLDAGSTWNRYGDTGENGGNVFNNPYIVATKSTNHEDSYALALTPWISINPLAGMNIKSTFTYSLNDWRNFQYSPSSLPVAETRHEGGTAKRMDTFKRNFLSETTVSYKKNWSKVHVLDVMAGFTAQKIVTDKDNVSGRGYLDDNVTFYNMGSIADHRNLSSSTDYKAVQRLSFIARGNYSYMSRYYITLTGRADGSSMFAEGHKWSFFPAVAAKWNISNESWMSDARIGGLSNLALRLSYGQSGNDSVSSYVSQATLGNGTGWLFGSTQEIGYWPDRLDNDTLTWEKTSSYNAGIDVILLNDRISMTLDGYYAKTTDLLLNMANASQTGFTKRYNNVGATQNMGVEFSITSNNISTSRFNWKTTFNISHNEQKVLDVGAENEYIAMYTKDGQMLYGYVKDYPVGALWGYQYAGVWHNQQEIDENKYTKAFRGQYNKTGASKYVDVNHDGVLDKRDWVYLGNTDHVVYGGFDNQFKIWGVTIDLFLTYGIGGKLYNMSEFYLGSNKASSNKYRYMMDSWHPVRNPDSDIPAAVGGSYEDKYASDRYVHDATYLRIKNLSVSYYFDLSRKNKVINGLTLGVDASNLYLFTAYNGYDPDLKSSGRRIDNKAYPTPRTFTFSVKLKF